MKCLIVQGLLTNGQLKYRPVGREFQFNKWFLKLNSVAFETTVAFEEAITVTCNFATSERYSSNSIITYEQPLQMFFVRVAANGKAVYRFIDNSWMQVNSPSSQLQFSFLTMNDELIQIPTLKCRLCFAIDQR